MVIYSSIGWIQKVGNVLTPGLRLPVKYFYLMIPLSSAFIIFYETIKIHSLFRPEAMCISGEVHLTGPDVVSNELTTGHGMEGTV